MLCNEMVCGWEEDDDDDEMVKRIRQTNEYPLNKWIFNVNVTNNQIHVTIFILLIQYINAIPFWCICICEMLYEEESIHSYI